MNKLTSELSKSLERQKKLRKSTDCRNAEQELKSFFARFAADFVSIDALKLIPADTNGYRREFQRSFYGSRAAWDAFTGHHKRISKILRQYLDPAVDDDFERYMELLGKLQMELFYFFITGQSAIEQFVVSLLFFCASFHPDRIRIVNTHGKDPPAPPRTFKRWKITVDAVTDCIMTGFEGQAVVTELSKLNASTNWKQWIRARNEFLHLCPPLWTTNRYDIIARRLPQKQLDEMDEKIIEEWLAENGDYLTLSDGSRIKIDNETVNDFYFWLLCQLLELARALDVLFTVYCPNKPTFR